MMEILQFAAYKIIGLIYKLFWVFPINKKKIIVNAFGGKGYCDHPASIIDALFRHNKKYDICLVLKDLTTSVPDGIRRVRRHSLQEMYEYATSKMIIENTRLPLYITKRRNQVYIETWHASMNFKKVGWAASFSTLCGRARVRHDAESADLMISNGSFSSLVYRRDFGYQGEILEVGSPRLDVLFRARNVRYDVLSKLGISDDKKLVLYAPTFRDDGDTSVYDIDYERLRKTLHWKFGGEWIILLRFHPVMRDYAKTIKYSSSLVNATVIPDIYDLFSTIDMLITDYSSTILEFSLLKKPSFIYATDLDRYQVSRGLYFDLNELPFPVSSSNDELAQHIEVFDEDKYQIELSSFMDKLGIIEKGDASDKVAEYIISKMGV